MFFFDFWRNHYNSPICCLLFIPKRSTRSSDTDENYTDYNIPCKIRVNNTIIVENNKEYTSNISSRHLGFFIDIFPCDHYPNKKWKRNLVQSIKHLYYGKSLFYRKNLSVKATVLSKIIHYTLPLFLLNKLKDLIIHSLNKDTKRNNIISKGIELPFHKGISTSQDIFPLQKIEFENMFFYAPNNTHSYLSSLYGSDYMTPPSKDKRICHSSEFYIIND
ncbi:LicD family protein [Providencia rettgeri]|uniref:LicD family protein n=1 Tax=Providencia rettgeri TaxID=587 RepID=UPI0024B8BC8C|nr:LicD family protein [Providencia rettgeri]